jgi:hypothetical protein
MGRSCLSSEAVVLWLVKVLFATQAVELVLGARLPFFGLN